MNAVKLVHINYRWNQDVDELLHHCFQWLSVELNNIYSFILGQVANSWNVNLFVAHYIDIESMQPVASLQSHTENLINQ